MLNLVAEHKVSKEHDQSRLSITHPKMRTMMGVELKVVVCSSPTNLLFIS